MKKKLVFMLAAAVSICCLGSCGKASVQQNMVNGEMQAEGTTSAAETSAIENTEQAILVVSFGTSYNDSRDLTIGAIEQAIEEAYPEYDIRRAFTSQIIIDILEERDGLKIDNVEEALDRAAADGVKELTVQPTHLMNGYEYQDLAKALTEYIDKFEKIILAEPLLTGEADFEAVAKAVTEKTASYDDGETAICFMGHGTAADSNAVYAKLQETLTKAGYENYYIGTVEAAPGIDDIITLLKEKGTYKKAVLQPLMVVSGDHASNDMAGEEEDSWKTTLEKAGYEVECVLEGLGQIPAIQDIYVAHIKQAVESGISFSGIAETESRSQAVGELENGLYDIIVESNSSMFHIEKAELTVADDSMTAVVTLGGTGYSKLYMGTGEQAKAADETDFIFYTEDSEGAYTYTIPVSGLDVPIDCAAFSKKKEEWYDRQITFLSASLLKTEAKAEDGIYEIDVTLEGGSGKTTIISPATVKIAGDSMKATVEWTSPNYDYMLVDGEKYLPVNTEGNSVFEIPVSAFDTALQVIGDTVAMSKPHEIEYTLTFHSETLKAAE